VRQVHDVDIIADARAVAGGIVIPKNDGFCALADGGFGDDGYEVVSYVAGRLANEGAGVCTGGVEVTQDNTLERGRTAQHVENNVLAHLLGAGVGRLGFLPRCAFGDGQLFDVAIYGAGGGENNIWDIELCHAIEEIEEAVEVIAKVEERFFNGFADGFEGGEVNDAGDVGVVVEYLFSRAEIGEVNGIVVDALAGDGLNAVEGAFVGVDKIVYGDNFKAVFD